MHAFMSKRSISAGCVFIKKKKREGIAKENDLMTAMGCNITAALPWL